MLLELTERGLYCAAGDFYVDPWRPVRRAVVTHAHADHARRGMGRYLAAQPGERLLRYRMGEEARIRSVPYGETVDVNGVMVSLHPAGHIRGSAQVRVEYRGEVWVVSGDYKTQPDPTCAPFVPVPCHTFVTEATFGLPIYRWPPPEQVFAELDEWWRGNQEAGKASVLFAYALGKAQRILAGVDATAGPIYVHGAVHNVVAPLWYHLHCLCLGLDAGPRPAPPPRRGSGLCPLRPRGLARADVGHWRDRG
jgi:putative mRNA 3-end processing factor